MLHLIFQSTFDDTLLHRIKNDDDIVFFENAIFRLNKKGALNNELQKLERLNIHLYVLNCDIETRGIQINELASGIEAIDYSCLVNLTVKNKIIRTWS